MSSEFGGTFERDRKEWTARKHKVLGQYVKVALAKLSQLRKPIALVDGYAGANQYGSEQVGSTRIMLDEAKKAIHSYGLDVKVFACEANRGTFNQLCKNLEEDIDRGLLCVFNGKHSSHVDEIKRKITSNPAVVFLDPNAPSQMIIDEDILPWSGRRTTDILGLYFGSLAARVASGAVKTVGAQGTAQRIFSQDWQNIESQAKAYDYFFDNIASLKK